MNLLRALVRLAFLITLAATTFLALTSEPLPLIDDSWDKANHFVAFFVLSFLLDFSIATPAAPFRLDNLCKASFLLAYAGSIECAQWYVGYRSFELNDIVAGFLGIVAYGAMMPMTDKIQVLHRLRMTYSQDS